jgi:hypothetical protein
VNHYRNHELPGCADPSEFVVRVQVGNQVRLFQGAVVRNDPQRQKVLVAEIPLP